MNFIFCLLARQPLFSSSKKQLDAYLKCVTKEFNYSYNEWMVGLNSYTLQKMKKLFHQENKCSLETIKKMIQLLIFMKTYKNVEQTLKILTA